MCRLRDSNTGYIGGNSFNTVPSSLFLIPPDAYVNHTASKIIPEYELIFIFQVHFHQFYIGHGICRQLPLEPLLRERRVLWQSGEAGRSNFRVVFVLPGLSSGSVEINNGAVITTAKTPTEVNADYFHLLVGICMESLCSSRATQPNSTVSACLSAFYSLLDSQWARTLIGKEQVMSTKCLVLLWIWAFKRIVNSDPALVEYCESDVITGVIVFLVLSYYNTKISK